MDHDIKKSNSFLQGVSSFNPLYISEITPKIMERVELTRLKREAKSVFEGIKIPSDRKGLVNFIKIIKELKDIS